MKTNIFFTLLITLVTIHCSAQSVNFTNNGTWVNVGDVDVSGSNLTVEALIYIGNGDAINIISKHINPSNGNYLLRPGTLELVTYVNGNSGPTQFLQLFNPIPFSSNTWYHVAGTYDGTTAKYYVNGCLAAELPFSGNLFQNDFLTAIGNQSDCVCEQFIGQVDEVRIWNVARTEDELRNNMLDLPDPTTQAGLIAYYKLDNSLVNNQGNPTFDGSFVGSVQFSTDEADIQPFAITDIQVTHADCDGENNGSIAVSANLPEAQYSLDGMNFQSSNTFANLSSGNLNLYVMSPDGCVVDSTLEIGNNDFHFSINDVANICEGESYLGYSITGIYTDTIPANVGCDSIRTLDLTVLPAVNSSLTISICEGEMYEGYTTSGTYTDTFTGINGCDSTRILMLSVEPGLESSQSISICQGQVYEGYTTSGTYMDTFTAIGGCDSTRTLILSVVPGLESSQSISICQGQIYEGYTTSGTYVDTFMTADGCDSTRTLTLTVSAGITSTQLVNICPGESYEGYTISGTYHGFFTTTSGCDSTRILILDVNTTNISSQSVTICAGSSYDFNGQIITAAGTYTDTIPTIGCDSIIILDVQFAQSGFLGDDVTVCSGNEYQLVSPSDSTRWFDNQISQTKTVNKTGTYWATILDADGCEITDTVSIQFSTLLYVPNAFSPNNDGANDCFRPNFSEPIINCDNCYQLSIFDRWGNHVFFTNNPDNCWNGESKGQECSPGAYIYYMEVQTEFCDKIQIGGDINLIK